jgi:hypothetical protein
VSVPIIRRLAALLAALVLSPAAGGAPDGRAGWLALVAQEAPSAALASTPTDTLRLADVLARVRDANPSVQAARLRAEAERERVSPAGAPSMTSAPTSA